MSIKHYLTELAASQAIVKQSTNIKQGDGKPRGHGHWNDMEGSRMAQRRESDTVLLLI